MSNTKSKTAKGKRTNKPRKGGRRRFTKPARATPNSAKVVEFFDLGQFDANVAHEFVLNGIVPTQRVGGMPTRAALVAPAYGLYRVAQIEYKVSAKYDTYLPSADQAGVAVGDQPVEVPKLYWKMNRYGDAPVGFTAEDMQSLGSKPIRLDDKTITIKYKPNILLANSGAAATAQDGGSGQVKITPWLSTDTEAGDNTFNLSTTEHYGHIMYIECSAGGDGVPVICEISARVVYEFKNPRILESAQSLARRQNTPHVKTTFSTPVVKNAPNSYTLPS